MAFTKYSLTDSQLWAIARLCNQEQGSIAGCKAEASLMANLLETSSSRQKKYGTDGTGLYNYVRNGGWFSKAAYWMDNGSATTAQFNAVKDVLCNGNRTLPQYIDEHDCLSDISSISTGSPWDRSAYVKNVTIVKNRYGSTWTFYEFPASGSDPFGYTSEAYAYVMKNGGTVLNSGNAEVEEEREMNDLKVSVPTVYQGEEGAAVRMWQAVVGASVDGDFGPNTKKATISWQEANGLKGDGIAGAKSWGKAFEKI